MSEEIPDEVRGMAIVLFRSGVPCRLIAERLGVRKWRVDAWHKQWADSLEPFTKVDLQDPDTRTMIDAYRQGTSSDPDSLPMLECMACHKWVDRLYARRMCVRCYARWRYHNVPGVKEKQAERRARPDARAREREQARKRYRENPEPKRRNNRIGKRKRRLTESHAGWGTRKTIVGRTPPGVDVSGMSEYCGNGHKWDPHTTRWRYRSRGSHGTGWERDCLVCKDMNDKSRVRMGRNVKGRNVTITVTATGTHWNSGTPGGKDYS